MPTVTVKDDDEAPPCPTRLTFAPASQPKPPYVPPPKKKQIVELLPKTDKLVVLAVDGTNLSDYTFEWFREHLYQDSHKLHICFVPEFRNYIAPESSSKDILKTLKELNAFSAVLKTKYETLLEQHKMKGCFVRVGGNNIWMAIVEYSLKNKASLILLGSHTACLSYGVCEQAMEKPRIKNVGSVSLDVLSHTTIPVLVIRSPHEHSLTLREKTQFYTEGKQIVLPAPIEETSTPKTVKELAIIPEAMVNVKKHTTLIVVSWHNDHCCVSNLMKLIHKMLTPLHNVEQIDISHQAPRRQSMREKDRESKELAKKQELTNAKLQECDQVIFMGSVFDCSLPPELNPTIQNLDAQHCYFKPCSAIVYTTQPVNEAKSELHRLRSTLMEKSFLCTPNGYAVPRVNAFIDELGNTLDERILQGIKKVISQLDWLDKACKAQKSRAPTAPVAPTK